MTDPTIPGAAESAPPVVPIFDEIGMTLAKSRVVIEDLGGTVPTIPGVGRPMRQRGKASEPADVIDFTARRHARMTDLQLGAARCRAAAAAIQADIDARAARRAAVVAPGGLEMTAQPTRAAAALIDFTAQRRARMDPIDAALEVVDVAIADLQAHEDACNAIKVRSRDSSP